VTTLQISEAIEIAAYLTSDPEENENSSCTDSSTTSDSVWGTALKNGPTTWTVFLKNKTQLTVSNKDLMNPSRFFVKGKCLADNLNVHKRKKQSAKQKRARLSEKLQKEQAIRERAREEQRNFERKEYENILTVMKSGNEYNFDDFLAMIDRIQKPFTCFINGHEVSITQDDAAIMMEKSVMKEITDSLFHAGDK